MLQQTHKKHKNMVVVCPSGTPPSPPPLPPPPLAHARMHNALQVHLLFLAVDKCVHGLGERGVGVYVGGVGTAHSKGQVAEGGKKSEWEQMMH